MFEKVLPDVLEWVVFLAPSPRCELCWNDVSTLLELSSTVGSSWMLASVSIAADLLRRLAARLTSVLRFDDHPTCPFTDSSSTEDTALTPLTPVIRQNTIHHWTGDNVVDAAVSDFHAVGIAEALGAVGVVQPRSIAGTGVVPSLTTGGHF